ncbi:hypothetical protein F1D05_30615 [Kribbella qitaiheensis]|uniref:Uncharacterized protein n=1 Tax=Kribbella qitaiheensis TaxID=1544730 RepID=A0A7G6X5G2_9ACTN|nr:hypothetical protein [Kribbella qitaiheensis]QNE21477.1 hypothetical protein F1D05_30615 [Kribbella qitaiheensis]
MDPLPFVDGRAGLAFTIAVGLFVVLQAGSTLVAAVRRGRSRASHVRMDRGTLPLVILFVAAGFIGAAQSAGRVGGATIALVPCF